MNRATQATSLAAVALLLGTALALARFDSNWLKGAGHDSDCARLVADAKSGWGGAAAAGNGGR